MRKNRFLIMILLFTAYHSSAQNNTERKTVSGKIIAVESREALQSISILALRNKATAVSDHEGLFSITLTQMPDTLEVSHIGYKTIRIPVTETQSNLIISLEVSATELDEVIVNTGYQKMKPNEANGSIVIIDNKTLNQQTGTNILQRLNGVTSGLLFNVGKSNGNPQNNTNISIRGLSTINGPLDPLIVLDNFIFEGDINNINPNDIESITILKDAAAASIWGARAGNGVIVITTKKGRFNQKLKIDFNSTVTLQEKPDLSYLPQMSSSDYVDVEQYLFSQGYFDDQISFNPHQALTPAVEIFLARRNGLISSTDSASQINVLKQIDSRDGFTKYFYKKALTEQYALSLKGGSNNIAWLVSGTYDRSRNSLDGKYNKVNLRVENTYRPIKNMSLTTGVYYTNSHSTSGALPFGSVQINGRSVPYLSFANDNGAPVSIANYYRDTYIDTAGNGKLLDWKYYPLTDYKHNKSTTRIEEIIANIGFDYSLLNGLHLNILYQYQRQLSNSETNSDLGSFYTRNYINLFSQIDPSTGIVNHIVPVGGILNQSNGQVNSQNLRAQFDFSRRFGNHHISAIVGAEIREAERTDNSLTLYGYQEDPLSYRTVDFINSYPTYITGEPRTISDGVFLSHNTNRFVSIYSNLSYIFKERYSAFASFRKDGSNLLGVKTNDKWKPLWSAGFGWNISKEKFYNLDWLPEVKLKTSIGYSGNVDVTRSALPVAAYGISFITNLPVAVIETINNTSLRWEQSRQWNIGVEFSGKNNRLSGSIEYYIKKGTDLYGPTPYDYTTWGGSNTITKNVANMKGNGLDIILNSRNINRSFKWNTQLLFNYNSSKTTAYFRPSAETIYSFLGGGNSITPVVGKPLYAIAAYRWGGLDASGNPQGYLNGQLSTDYQAIADEALQKGSDNIKYIGSATPTYFGSIINQFAYKQVSLSINVSYKLGYYFLKPSLHYTALFSGGPGHKDYAKRWQQPGDEKNTNVPSFLYPADPNRDGFYSASEINVLKADHIRLQYITCSYSFVKDGKSLLKRFIDLQLYINAANIGILWKANKENLDPDYPATIQPPRSYSAGIRASF